MTVEMSTLTVNDTAFEIVDAKARLDIIEAKAQIARQEINFANSLAELEESGDTSKVYVLPNGNIAAYALYTASYTNQIPLSIAADGSDFVGTNGEDGYKVGYRINSSGQEIAADGMCISGYIRVMNGDAIRIKNITLKGGSTPYLLIYSPNKVFLSAISIANTFIYDESLNMYSCDTLGFTDGGFIRLSVGNITEDSIVTINEEIQGSTTGGYAWQELELNIFAGACSDLVGFVAENNVIYLSDNNLPAGTYTLKYASGDYDTIGTITVE